LAIFLLIENTSERKIWLIKYGLVIIFPLEDDAKASSIGYLENINLAYLC
jgi:hypothetical protein